VLHDAFPDAYIKIADEEYTTTTLDEFNAWIRDDMVSERSYYRGWSDCDNFSRALRCAMFKINREYKTEFTMPYTEGMSPGGYHAFNVFLDSDDNVYVVEPQDDNVVPYHKSVYTPDFIEL
jgi:endonuclease/exonuclease/phosphatase (EEP) superfamily protein YafD